MAHRIDIEVEEFGQRYGGTYSLRGDMVTVRYGATKKATQIGNSRPDYVARSLLLEMVRETETVH